MVAQADLAMRGPRQMAMEVVEKVSEPKSTGAQSGAGGH
jgi:hypothetical protein